MVVVSGLGVYWFRRNLISTADAVVVLEGRMPAAWGLSLGFVGQKDEDDEVVL